MKKEFYLENLGCANCAAKMENKINNLSNINSAAVDFVNKKLYLDIKDESSFESTITECKNIIKAIESDVKVQDIEERENNHEEHIGKLEVATILAGGIIYFAALIFKLPEEIEIAMFLVSYFIIGGEIIKKAILNIVKGDFFDENFLMVIATIGAISIKQFPEAVAVMLFYKVGELFQDMAVDNSRKSIKELMDIKPEYANLKCGIKTKKVSPEEVNEGDIILVKAGEKVPLDGVVISGEAMFDTAALTGEAVLKRVKHNSEVLSGSINTNGLINIKVTKRFSESTVSKILDLVENAAVKKAKTENFITKFARMYTPAVVLAASLLAVIPPFIFKNGTFSDWLYRALIFLVVSCPCALVISIPLSFFAGIGAASKNGILIKGSNYLEALNKVSTVVFDKTGTLTKGNFAVTSVEAKNYFSKEQVLKYAAFAESHSNHPIAIAINKYYSEKLINDEISNYEELSGYGIKVNVSGKEILAGNNKLMYKYKINFEEAAEIGTIVYIAVDNVYAGNIVINDEIKEDSKLAINAIKSRGIEKTVILTGDNKANAEEVASYLGADEVYYELLPQDKVQKIEDIINKGKKVIFVGDGINDAPVLARADVGISMGSIGSDAAIEASDIVIMKDEPSKVATAIKIAKKTRIVVLENIIFALGVKAVVLLMGAAGYATMWEAVFADVGVALIAVINATRILKLK